MYGRGLRVPWNPLCLVLDAKIAPIHDGAHAFVERLHDRHERVRMSELCPPWFSGIGITPNSAAEVDELLVQNRR